ncbi:MAG TPA: hypothetical protein VFO83_05405 [Aggregicoccus sp.]|nr:hypothetical protein [Aggregicoccus sp.]
MLSPSPDLPSASTCRTHPATSVASFCTACGGPFCAVCLFTTPQGPLCPECAMRPPTQAGSSRLLLRSLLSLLGAVVGTGTLFAMFLWQALSGTEMPEGVSSLLGILALVSTVGGLSMGLLARDAARGRRSPLALVGLISNGILLALYVTLAVVGIAMGEG